MRLPAASLPHRSSLRDPLRTPASGDDPQAAVRAFLQQPGAYPDATREVAVIETHMSWLFLTDHRAYKLKKPMRRDLIDYGSVAARRRSCVREVALNRRLAAQVYRGVVAVRRDRCGQLALDGRGRSLDWLVCMQRLPLVQSLEHQLRCGDGGHARAAAIGARLWQLYRDAPRPQFGAAALRRRELAEIVRSERVLSTPAYRLPAREIERAGALLRQWLDRHGGLLDASAERLADGHGDLRPEHIYFTDPLAIIDCIEFSRTLRLRDPFDELAFLALECERRGARGWRRALVAAYARCSGLAPPPVTLLDFYQAAHAHKRARLALQHIGDPDTGPAWHWVTSARDYLGRAIALLDGAGVSQRRHR